jgi:two-component system nitrogen regulation sensor histidine kinase NtrY
LEFHGLHFIVSLRNLGFSLLVGNKYQISMFKSIEYKLYIGMALLLASVAAATYFAISGEYLYFGLSILVTLWMLVLLRWHFSKFNKNIVFLLNALENGDFSFRFRETRLSARERELNRMLNRIKEILIKARNEVQENEKFLSVILESIPTGIFILSEDVVLSCNSAALQLLGLPVLTHINQLSMVGRDLPDTIRHLGSNDITTIRVPNEREVLQLSLRSSMTVVKGEKMKIITLQNIGSELEHAEMDSWIRLIRVLTHEIMNSIAPVTSLTDTLLSAYTEADNYPEEVGGEDYDSDQANGNDETSLQSEEAFSLRQDTIEALQTINSTAHGLITFVNSYRQFTGVPKPRLKPVSLTQLIEDTIALEVSEADRRGVKLSAELPEGDIVIAIDEAQIRQVLINLIKNAVEAIGVRSDASIRLVLKATEDKVILDVYDNGPGIPDDVLPDIFVPFFTTKEQGNGIGLSLSRYIVRLHGGTLTYFREGGWTVFRLLFVVRNVLQE